MTPLAALWLGLDLADWVVLALYFVVILVVGFWSAMKVSDMADFFMGGRRFGKVFMMFFAFGSGTSSEQAISVVAGTWRVGLAGIWWQFLWLFATPFYWIVAPVLRRMRALTTADFFEARFGRSTAVLYSVYGIVMAIVFIAGGLYSSGKMVNALTGGELDRIAQVRNVHVPAIQWDEEAKSFGLGTRRVEGYEYAIVAMTVLFVAYGMAGGLGAAIVTDFIQGVLTITFSFLLLPFVFAMVGGFGGLNEAGAVKPGMLDLFASGEVMAQAAARLGKEPITLFYVFMLSVTALAGIVVQPHIMGVCGAGKTEFEGRFGFTFGNFLKRFCTIAWTFTGLACIVWYLGADSPLKDSDPALYADLRASVSEDFGELPEDERARIGKVENDFADELFGRAAYDILPTILPGLVGLLLASLLAAVMSTSDAQMVVGSGLFTENIYRRYWVKDASQRHYVWVGRIAGLVIVLFALFLQSTFTDVIHALKVIIKTPAAIGISLWFGIVWRRWTTSAVWASTFAAVGTWAFVAYRPDAAATFLPGGMFKPNGNMADAWQMFAYVAMGIAVGVTVSLLTRREDEEKLDRFYQLLHTPVQPDEEVPAPCTLPDDHAEPEPKLFPNSRDWEFPKPTKLDVYGFVAAWVLVGLIIVFVRWLANVA